jgi:membrane fusion protein (multidrug efflux system)
MEEKKQPAINRKRKTVSIFIFAAIAVIGTITILIYLSYKSTHITTDDAFVDGRIHVISAKIEGSVMKVNVQDNQFVKKGDVLIEIDPVDYDIKVETALAGLNAEKAKLSEANAQIETVKKQLSELTAGVETARANLDLQEANLKQADIDLGRAENLYKKEAISKERYEKTETNHKVILARVKAEREKLKQAEIALDTQKALIRQAEAAKVAQKSEIKRKETILEEAKVNFGYTKVYAPADGYITKKSVEVGNRIKVAQPLMAVVPLNDIWIIANYKETQLEKVRPGQDVKIEVDSYPKKIFKGKVDSVMAGTGAAFSLFPPENATGNYVKVVQRIPVKIVLNKEEDSEHILRVGMSVVPTILIKN